MRAVFLTNKLNYLWPVIFLLKFFFFWWSVYLREKEREITRFKLVIFFISHTRFHCPVFVHRSTFNIWQLESFPGRRQLTSCEQSSLWISQRKQWKTNSKKTKRTRRGWDVERANELEKKTLDVAWLKDYLSRICEVKFIQLHCQSSKQMVISFTLSFWL